jgi:pimeloyl-ACP methyl ester carboxylesterase
VQKSNKRQPPCSHRWRALLRLRLRLLWLRPGDHLPRHAAAADSTPKYPTRWRLGGGTSTGQQDRRGHRFWSATDACCNLDGLAVDDVAYLRAVIRDVSARHAVDPRRVFIVGHSNGGFMAHRMACEASDLVAAVVSLAGAP